jgi:hypothetical protein
MLYLLFLCLFLFVYNNSHCIAALNSASNSDILCNQIELCVLELNEFCLLMNDMHDAMLMKADWAG